MIEPGTFESSSPADTEAFGFRVGESIDEATILLLTGDLGAGKTLFTRGLAAGLGADPNDVSSPTFSLVNRYTGGRFVIYHLDLYRLSGPHAAYDIGLEEILDEAAIVAVEWPDRLDGFPVPTAYDVEIASIGDERRILTVRKRAASPGGAPTPR